MKVGAIALAAVCLMYGGTINRGVLMKGERSLLLRGIRMRRVLAFDVHVSEGKYRVSTRGEVYIPP